MSNEVEPLKIVPEFAQVMGEKINEITAELKPLMNLKAGQNITITVSDSDILIEANGAGLSGDGTGSPQPFSVVSDNAGNGAIFYGKLYDQDRTTSLTITALTTPVALTVGDFWWINVPIDGTTLTQSGTINLVTGSTEPAEITWDTSTPPLQTALNIQVGEVISGLNPNFPGFDFGGDSHFIQKLNTNLALCVACSGSGPAVYAAPFTGR